MWPWGHLAAGYLLYSAGTRLSTRDSPADVSTLVALFGTQLPDLVDKPLAWSLSVLPTGRSLAHSLVVATPVLAIGWFLTARRDARPLVAALGVGWVSHSFTDALYPLLGLHFDEVTFLAWPLLPLPTYEVDQSFAAHFALVSPSPTFLFELLLVVLASVAWYADGHPGLATVRSWSGRLLAAATEQ